MQVEKTMEDITGGEKLYTLRTDDYDPADPDVLQEKISCRVELEYRYGPIVRVISSSGDKKETKVRIEDYDEKVVKVSSNAEEKEWVLEALDTCGFTIVDDEGEQVEV